MIAPVHCCPHNALGHPDASQRHPGAISYGSEKNYSRMNTDFVWV